MKTSIIRWLEKEEQMGKHLKLHHLKTLVAPTRSQMTCYLTFLFFPQYALVCFMNRNNVITFGIAF